MEGLGQSKHQKSKALRGHCKVKSRALGVLTGTSISSLVNREK